MTIPTQNTLFIYHLLHLFLTGCLRTRLGLLLSYYDGFGYFCRNIEGTGQTFANNVWIAAVLTSHGTGEIAVVISNALTVYPLHHICGHASEACGYVIKCDNMRLCLRAEGRISIQSVVIGPSSVVLRQNQK